MEKYIIAIDLGTTSIRVIVFNKLGEVIKMFQEEFEQIFPKPSWVEQNPKEIWEVTEKLLNKALDLYDSRIECIGITNQRETTVLWDDQGEPIYNAIVWQSKQSVEICEQLISSGFESEVKNRTGLKIDPYFSASKIKWVKDNVGFKSKPVYFGTIDSWILWNLTGGNVHATDYSNASRTLLFNIYDLKWDQKLIDIFDLCDVILPKVCSSVYNYGTYKGIKISAMAGDQHASLFGQTCFAPGVIKNTYGTGCFLMTNTANVPVKSNSGLLTTIAWEINGEVSYALEGSIFIAGSVIT